MIERLQSAWDAIAGIPYLLPVAGGLYVVYLVWLGAFIILQKREPVATLSWILSLAFLPYVGYLVYFLFGPQKIKRQSIRRHLSRERLDAASLVGTEDVHCTELALLGHATTGLAPSTARSVDLLIDGGATYTAILEAVSRARHHVHLEYYIYMPDHIGTALRDALVERARAGVKVRLLMDAVGSSKVRKRFLQPLLDAGGEVAWFHPTTFKLFTRTWVNLRSHRKIVVVDGEVAFTGGINITDEEDERLRGDAYRDTHLRLAGPVVRSVQLIFIEDWLYASGGDRMAFADRRYWPRQEAGPVNAQVVVSGPDSSWEAIHRMHVGAIHEARKRVWLATPYFVPGEAARMALTSAALGGLDTRLIVPKVSDSRLVTYAARSYFDELLAAGVKIHEYGPRMLHTKALLCDDDLALVGSANFDHRSFRLNFEISVLIRDRGVAAQLERHLQGELEAAPEVRRDRQRSLWRNRLPEALARLLSPVL